MKHTRLLWHTRGAILFLSLMACTNAWAATAVAFYIVGHQDDWQLFMVPNAYNDVQNASAKVVFIYTTAGDAGLGTGSAGRKQPYYLARENGAINAVRFIADSSSMPAGESRVVVSANSHRIYRYAYKNTVSYFLRLPDGRPDGTGFAGTNYQSLKKLMSGTISKMTAIDGSTTYFGWNDLVSTIEKIILTEGTRIPTVWMNTDDYDTTLNPGDHSDHIVTGQLARSAISRLPCISLALYVGYETANRSVNLALKDAINEAAVFGVTVSGIINFDNQGQWNTGHKAWLGRNYLRSIKSNMTCNY